MLRRLQLGSPKVRMRTLQAAAACCFTAALLVVCCQGRGLSAAKDLDMPRLTNDTLLHHLQLVATPGRELVYTTTSAWTDPIVDMLKNFMYHMHAVGRAKNMMVISQDEGTCEKLLVSASTMLRASRRACAKPAKWHVDVANAALHYSMTATYVIMQAMNIPCYLDDVSPKSHDFPKGHRYGQRPYDFGKIWWSLRLAQLGYTSLYLDNDVAAVKDPLAADIVQSPYDLEVHS